MRWSLTRSHVDRRCVELCSARDLTLEVPEPSDPRAQALRRRAQARGRQAIDHGALAEVAAREVLDFCSGSRRRAHRRAATARFRDRPAVVGAWSGQGHR